MQQGDNQEDGHEEPYEVVDGFAWIAYSSLAESSLGACTAALTAEPEMVAGLAFGTGLIGYRKHIQSLRCLLDYFAFTGLTAARTRHQRFQEFS